MRGLKKAAGSRKNKKHRFVPTQPSDQYRIITIKSYGITQKVYVYSSAVDPNQKSRKPGHAARFQNIQSCFPLLSRNLGNV